MSGSRRRRGVATHPWSLCRPALVGIEGADPAATEAFSAATQRVWATLDMRQRRLFHEYTCEDKTSGSHMVNMTIIRQAIAEQVRRDQRRHAENAGKVLEFMDQLGMKTLDPEPGQEVNVLCTRVIDSMRLGDDPYPALAARRRVTSCSLCGFNVFIDPASYGQGVPTVICTRCFSPEMAREIDNLIETAGGKTDD
jgi:hypothetical protein